MSLQTSLTILMVLVALATLLGLVGVWFPELFKNDVGWKLVWTFVVIIVGVGTATGLLQYFQK